MDSHKLSLKLFADNAERLTHDAIVPIFHHWIQEQAFAGHLLIDVADYAHVPNGPGTLIVAHEANIHFDREDGRPGLFYLRKQPIPGADSFRERLAAVFRATVFAANKLQSDPSIAGIKFRTDEIVFRIHDRLLAPNTAETYSAVRGDLQSFLTELFKGDVTLEHKQDNERLFEVRIRTSGKAGLADLLGRLEGSAAASMR
jgi:hypothetical protein